MTDAQIEVLLAEAERWHGTPFRANSCACGPRGGVGCVNYVAALLTAAGALPAIVVPRYRLDSGNHLDESPLVEFLRGRAPYADSPRVARCLHEYDQAEPTEPGDLIVLNAGRTEFHTGVVLTLDGHFTHVLVSREVTVSTLRDSTYADSLRAIFRPVQPEEAD